MNVKESLNLKNVHIYLPNYQKVEEEKIQEEEKEKQEEEEKEEKEEKVVKE